MGDVGDYWRDIKEAQKERKAETQERNLLILSYRYPEIDEQCINVLEHSDTHWTLTLKNGQKIQFWPTVMKWQEKASERSKSGDFDSFVNRLVKLNNN